MLILLILMFGLGWFVMLVRDRVIDAMTYPDIFDMYKLIIPLLGTVVFAMLIGIVIMCLAQDTANLRP